MKTIVPNALYEDGDKIYLTHLSGFSDPQSLKRGGAFLMAYGLIGFLCVGFAMAILTSGDLFSPLNFIPLIGLGIFVVGVGFWYAGREAAQQKDNYGFLTQRHLILDMSRRTVTLHTTSGDQHLGDLKDFYVEMNRYPTSKGGRRSVTARIGSTSLIVLNWSGQLEYDYEARVRQYLEDRKINLVRTLTPWIGQTKPDTDYERYLSVRSDEKKQEE